MPSEKGKHLLNDNKRQLGQITMLNVTIQLIKYLQFVEVFNSDYSRV